MQLDGVYLQTGLFSVTGKGNKTRPVVVGHFARRELWSYLSRYRMKLDTDSTALFISRQGTPLTYNGLKQIFRILKQKSGISRVGVHAHICRHTFATIAHRNGMRGSTLQEALGHTKFDITRRYYLDISKEDLAAEHALYGPLDNMGRALKQSRTGHGELGAGRLSNADVGRAIDLPSADVLAQEVAQSNFRSVGRKYGVSDTTIRNRLRRAGLLHSF